jgi:hypothetical protein
MAGVRVLDRRIRRALQAQALLQTATTQGVNVGSAAILDNIQKGTLLVYYKTVNVDAANRFWQKGLGANNNWRIFRQGTTGSGRLTVDYFRATQTLFVDANVTAFPAILSGEWSYTGFNWDTAGANTDQKIFGGNLGAPAAEPSSYVTQRVGSGSIGDESGEDGWLLNLSLLTTGFLGTTAVAALLRDRTLSLEEHRVWQELMEMGPDVMLNTPLPGMESCVGLWFPGLHDGPTVYDHSGYGNHGVSVATTRAGSMPGWVRKPRTSYVVQPGVALVAVRNETAEAPETMVRVLGIRRIRSETAELAEGALRVLGLVRLRGEVLEASEAVLRRLGLVRHRAETAEIPETQVRTLGLTRLRPETVEVPETRVRVVGIVRGRDETAELPEGLIKRLGIVRGRNETADVIEVGIRLLGVLRVRGETVELAEGILGIRGLVVIRGETIEVIEGRLGIVAAAFLGAFAAILELLPFFKMGIQVDPAYVETPDVTPLFAAQAELLPEDES